MKKEFCINKTGLVELRKKKNSERADFISSQFPHLTIGQKIIQVENEVGDFHEAMKANNAAFTKNTDNVEMYLSIDLAEFYFPGKDAEICLEMKAGSNIKNMDNWDAIVNGLEKDTHVDCSINFEGKRFNFQIKRYPQEYLAFETEKMSKFIEKTVSGYGSMSNTILIIVLQPKSQPEGKFDFKEIHIQVQKFKSKITFDEVAFVFNDENVQLTWVQVYPNFGHSQKPLILESEKYKKVQLDAKKRLGL